MGNEKKRLYILDAFRGFLLVHMIAHHTLWDLVYIYDVDIPWFQGIGAYVWQQWGCISFIMLSGFCMAFGRRRLRRALIILGCASLVTLITIAFMPKSAVHFGVLTLLGSCSLLSIPLERPLSKLNPYLGLLISLSLFLFSRNIPSGFLGFYSFDFFKLPDGLYSNFFTAYLGFPPSGFYSSDYFPLLPWFFAYFSGYFIFRIFKKHDKLSVFSAFRSRPFEFLGRHSLIIYMVHQPIIYGFLHLLSARSLI